MYYSGTDMDSAELNALMRPRNICICKNVSKAEIERAVAGGASTFTAVQKETNCSTGCGTCSGQVKELIDSLVEAEAEKPSDHRP